MDTQLHYRVIGPDVAPGVGLEPGWWGLLGVAHGPAGEHATLATADPERMRTMFVHEGPFIDREPYELIRPGWLDSWPTTGAQCWDDL